MLKVAAFCTIALFQTIAGQCLGNPFNSAFGLATNGLSANGIGGNLANGGLAGNFVAGNGFGFNGVYGAGNCGGVASTGGGLSVISSSPNAPTGVSIVSENTYEGNLSAGGNLPLLGTVAVEGNVPTSGAGAVSYGCGDGAVGIVNESPIATGIVSPASYPPAGLAGSGFSGLGYNGFGGIGLNGLGRFGLGAGNCSP